MPEIASIQKESLHKHYKTIGHKEFLLHQAEGLPLHLMWNAYHDEALRFLKTVREIPVHEVPKNSNIIASHVIYKLKEMDDESFKMKARIAPNGNKGKDKDMLETDSSQCPLTEMGTIVPIQPVMQWPLAKTDYTSAFLQTGEAKRDVYVVPPGEIRRKSFYSLLLTSGYGLFNANGKWQEHCHILFSKLGFDQSCFVPQLFFTSKNMEIDITAVKIVDEALIAGKRVGFRISFHPSNVNIDFELLHSDPAPFCLMGSKLS